MACRLILGRCILPHLQGSPLTTKVRVKNVQMYHVNKAKKVLNLNPLRPQVYCVQPCYVFFSFQPITTTKNCKSHTKLKRQCRKILNHRFFSMNNPLHPPPAVLKKKGRFSKIFKTQGRNSAAKDTVRKLITDVNLSVV
jgi:hypothetical protein